MTLNAADEATDAIAEIMLRCMGSGTTPSDAPEILHAVITARLDAFGAQARAAAIEEAAMACENNACDNSCGGAVRVVLNGDQP